MPPATRHLPPGTCHLTCDVAVIGAGGAGLRAAGVAAAAGLKVVCVSKVPPTRSHTVAAQGGINAALGNRAADDWRWHMYDTIRGGDWLCDQDAVAVMCAEAPAAIAELEQMGMPFTRAEDGRIYQRAYGGQRAEFGAGGLVYRACAVADRTGHSLLHTLYAQAVRAGVGFMEECIALDLLFAADGACAGVLLWQLETGELHVLRAQRVVLATGGYGQAWAATTSSSICTGDGGGMALRAGLALQDMEFVQFHPTSLYASGILITEGARGEGAYLTNGAGERFLSRYAPSTMELASRDVIARAMAVEIREGRGAGETRDHVLLHLEHLGEALVREKLPSVLEIARRFAQVDALREPVPVLPAVHFTMGGIPTNAQCETDAPGLLALGEAACVSVHGANRLGCNALLDLVVFGKRAGVACAEALTPGAALPRLPEQALEAALGHFEALRRARGGSRPVALRKELQRIMQGHAGIFRNREVLAEGKALLEALAARFTGDLQAGDGSLLWNNTLAEALEVENLLLQAQATVEAALWREESRGAHWREDFPARNDAAWLTHSAVRREGGAFVMGRREVRMVEDAVFAPKERSY